MKKNILSVGLLAIFFIFSLQSLSQSFSVTYDFSAFVPAAGKTDPTPVPLAEGLIFGSFSASPAVSDRSTASNRFSFSNWDLGAEQGRDVFTGSLNPDKYYEVILRPVMNYMVDLDSVSFTLQRSGTGIRQYSVRAGADNFSSNLPAKIYPLSNKLQVTADNIFQVTDASTSANNGSKIVLSAAAFKNISKPLAFRFYGFNAESAAGTFSIDNVTFFGSSTLSPSVPDIQPGTKRLSFPGTDIHGGKAVLSYVVKGVNLTDALQISVPAPYGLAAAEAGPFTSSVSFGPAEVNTGKIVYVQFAPLTAGTFPASIVHASTGAVPREILVSGDGIDQGNLLFNFNDCKPLEVPGSGFTAYSVAGDQKWACSSYGFEKTNGIDISGFAGGAQENEDWLISPVLNFGAMNLPVLRFWSRGEFSGNTLQLLISTNYDGTGNPNDFSWTDLNADFPPLNNVWEPTDGIDLSPYKTASPVYIAFKYTSSAGAGASRWTIDEVSITNRTLLLTVRPAVIDFEEIASGSHSAGFPVKLKAAGYGDIHLTAPAAFEVSADGILYSPALSIPASAALAGETFFIRFAPQSRQLKVAGAVVFTGTGLDSVALQLVGSSYPKSETFDAGAYNLSFFGSTPENNPTPEKIDLQVNNIARVLKKIKLDIIGFEEMSSDAALASLLTKLPGHQSITSPRWSYSFDPPDPAFPPQKTGFIFDAATTTLVSSRAMFADLYDKARTTDPNLIPAYPTGSPAGFWASGRLPFLATFKVNIQGKTKQIHLIDIHGKSSSDKNSFERRKYDMQVLKDTLDAFFAGENVIIVGDYNDRAYQSIYAGSNVSPFQSWVDDAKYDVLTLPLDIAGAVSFINGSGLIDHITITDDLVPFYLPNSTEIHDARTYIPNYNATTASDHLPVFSRFDFSSVLPVKLLSFTAQLKAHMVEVNWVTTNEVYNQYYEVEKSTDAVHFAPIARVENPAGNKENNFYSILDSLPGRGIKYYRLKQVDKDGRVQYSLTVAVNLGYMLSAKINLYPNPVKHHITVTLPKSDVYYTGFVFSLEGKGMFSVKGDQNQINRAINARLFKLTTGTYVLKLQQGATEYVARFVRE